MSAAPLTSMPVPICCVSCGCTRSPAAPRRSKRCANLRDALNAKGGKYANFPMWYPDLCGKAHDPEEVSMQDLKDLGVYKLTGIHFSCHAAMLAMLDVGRHVLMEQSNDYVDYHFDDTGYKTFTTMSMFGDGRQLGRSRERLRA